jgi:protein-disulfide isomerase
MNAYPAAIAAEAAGLQGNEKFWAMEDLIFTNQSEWENVKDPSSIFAKYAKTIGLDEVRFAKDVKDDAIRQKISDSYRTAFKGGIAQTPTFFLNGKQIQNPTSYESFKKIIDAEIQ